MDRRERFLEEDQSFSNSRDQQVYNLNHYAMKGQQSHQARRQALKTPPNKNKIIKSPHPEDYKKTFDRQNNGASTNSRDKSHQN